jgi:hypothetical protein
VGFVHLFFDDPIASNIYYLNSQLLHIGLFPSVVLRMFAKGKAGKMITTTLVIYNGINFFMEILAIYGYEDLVLKINSYYYSELLFVTLALLLCITGTILKNGVYNSYNSKLITFLVLLRRIVTFKQRT